ncbi:DUF1349 domain-containing protein [Streptomyces sp. CB03911]|uniref:DUF1349 domain-containing protein n=1 Tax=Streptomyces sp. CB03911 TaxID=1804758 RepID=UPI00093D32AE|nr:DUF1349 domain-containing protein [Streptomyces sp. CB03911]
MATTQDAGIVHTAHSTTIGSATFSNLQIVASPYLAYSSVPGAVDQYAGKVSLTNAGQDTWAAGTAYDDQYTSAYRPAAAGIGATVTTHVDAQDNTSSWGKAGVMLRNNIAGAGTSPGYAAIFATPGQGVTLEWDSNGDGYPDAVTTKTGTAAVAPVWLRLVRNGTTVTGAYSADGTTWTTVGTATPSTPATTQEAGVVFSAHGGPGTATFSQFSITS